MNEWKTAIGRKKPSAPAERLAGEGLIVGRTLDYGCGRGYDASHLGAEKYDPHFAPVMPDGKFDTILCLYVLNVIESAETREGVIRDVLDRLNPGGCAYFAVRTDKASLRGRTSKGTWQGLVVLDAPIAAVGSGYKVYSVRKG
jgi:hypothetical protein